MGSRLLGYIFACLPTQARYDMWRYGDEQTYLSTLFCACGGGVFAPLLAVVRCRHTFVYFFQALYFCGCGGAAYRHRLWHTHGARTVSLFPLYGIGARGNRSAYFGASVFHRQEPSRDTIVSPCGPSTSSE